MPINNYKLLWLQLFLLPVIISAQDANIVLSQGTLVGLKVFPETSRIPIYAYLGVPYAQPPIADLRFAPPIPMSSWNRTLIAREFKPICPQMEENVYEETADGYTGRRLVDEDCLYLNIWAPETAFRYGKFPVLVIVTGEEYAFDWLNRPSGLDLASEGVVVVTVQYRMNIFGWLTLESEHAPGNLGLRDQQLAIAWVKDNIVKFGGDPTKITLLGHGTSGAATATLQMMLPRSKNKLTKVILMGGTLLAPHSPSLTGKVEHPSTRLVQILACGGGNKRYVIRCLRQKSVSDLLRAYETIYQNGNSSWILGPIVDPFMPYETRCFQDEFNLYDEMRGLLEKPLMIGITSNEAAFMKEQWVDLGKQGQKMLKAYIDDTILPNVIEQFRFPPAARKQIKETISWRFFDQLPPDPPYLINAMQKLLTETKSVYPFYQTIELIANPPVGSANDTAPTDPTNSSKPGPFYVYVFQHSNSMDLRGKINFFGGASHSSELPFLFGPSLFQQIARRRLSQNEDKLCKKFRSLIVEFIKTSNPTPGRLFDTWHPYTADQKYIKMIGSRLEKVASSETVDSTFEDNLQKIEQMLIPVTEEIQIVSSAVNPYNISPRDQLQEAATRTGKNAVYIDEAKNSEYYYYLRRVYGFWNDFLPKLAKMERRSIDGVDEADPIGYTEQDNQKYKHAFFSMLSLVCLLLAILGVCVYILKRNTDNELGSGQFL